MPCHLRATCTTVPNTFSICQAIWSLALYYISKLGHFQRFLWSLANTVHQKDLLKDASVCLDVQMLEYKERYPDNSEDPPDVGLSSEDEAMGMEEIVSIACRVILSRSSPAPPASKPSTSQPTKTATPPVDPGASEPARGPTKSPEGYVKLAKDEVIIKKAVLHGIKQGAELALKGQTPATFSPVTAGDIPFEVPDPAPNQMYCDICKKDLPTPKALRHHLRFHKGKMNYPCLRCGKHLASSCTFDVHKESCSSSDFVHNCRECGKGYHNKQSLVEHLKTKHQPTPSVEARTCPKCGVVFNLIKTMREYRVMHRGHFPCPVEDCKENFSLPK